MTKDEKILLTQIVEKLDRQFTQEQELVVLLKSIPGAIKRLLIKFLEELDKGQANA